MATETSPMVTLTLHTYEEDFHSGRVDETEEKLSVSSDGVIAKIKEIFETFDHLTLVGNSIGFRESFATSVKIITVYFPPEFKKLVHSTLTQHRQQFLLAEIEANKDILDLIKCRVDAFEEDIATAEKELAELAVFDV